MRSESALFIWQPTVQMWKRPALGALCGVASMVMVGGLSMGMELAEGMGFEPMRELNTPNPLSRRAH